MIDKRPKTPREVAAFSLFSMAEEAAWSDGALHHYLSRAGLDSRDAALASRLTYGTVQNQILLDWYLRHFSSVRLKKIAPRVLACLRMGLYQLILMDKIPAHAAVAETVALVKHYGHANDRTVAFANAVLRNAANAAQNGSLPRLNCPDKESYYALQYSHPEWLVRLLSEQYGQKLTQKICQADNADAPISVRVNTMKCTPAEAQAELEAAGLTVQPHEAFPEILLCSGGDAAALPAFIEGRVTVQDAAWVPQEKLLTVSLRAVEADPQTQELHPMWNLDPDGSYVGDDAEALAEDEEARSEHWLLTEKGFGPVREMMNDGSKELLLFEADRVLLGTPDNAVEIVGNGSSMDSFVGEDGAVITVLKMELPWMDEGYEAQIMALEGMEEAQKERLVTQARAAREALLVQTGGELSLCVPYEVSTYVEGDDEALYCGGVKGWVSFRIRVEENAQ